MCYEVGETLGVLQWPQLEGGPGGCGAVRLSASSVQKCPLLEGRQRVLPSAAAPTAARLSPCAVGWKCGAAAPTEPLGLCSVISRSFLVWVVACGFPWRLLPTHKATKLLHF